MGKELDQNQLRKFGERFKVIRTEKNLSFRRLSQLCDIDYSDLSKIEKGQINITLLTLIDLAKGLGVHPRELLDVEFE
mgnify:CR=1 FL=1